MTRVLMLDVDQRLVAAVARALLQEGIEVVGVSCVERARACAREGRTDLALLDGDLIDEAELSAFAPLPVIVTTSFLEPAGDHRFFPHARLLRKPFTNAQLLSALRESCAALAAEPASLVDLLRRAHSDKQTLSLRVGAAEVFLEDGELVHVERGGVGGERALAEVLAQPYQPVQVIPTRPVPRTIQRPFRALLLDVLRSLDEREQRERALPRRLRPQDPES